MLKYVSRHVRDSLERTCNVLQRKSFVCKKDLDNEGNNKVAVITKPEKYYYVVETEEFRRQTGGDDFKNFKKKYQSNRYNSSNCPKSWLSALTWVS